MQVQKKRQKWRKKTKRSTVLGQKESSQVFEANTWEKEVLQEKIATCTT